ncbi:FO synthase subunit 1, partial [Durusdinium trenchii]
YLQRPLANVGFARNAQVRGDICTFLEYLYDSVAETLPDFRDEMGSSSTVRLTVEDPYAKEMQNQQSVDESLEEVDLRPRTKPRKRKGQVQINMSRTSATMEERFLPPSSMKEYYEQYRSQLKQAGMKQDVQFYVKSARKAIIIDTAAQAWARGVPWEEALRISEQAMSAAGTGLTSKVFPMGGPDKYLSHVYNDPAKMLDFADWIDQCAPPDPRMLTDPNLPGVEKISTASIPKEFLDGKGEAEAVSALMTAIPPSVVEILEDAVRKRGMLRFITHEATLVVNRLIRDHDNTAPQLRKAFSFKDALAVHQAGGAFLHFLSVLQKMAPAALYTQAEVSLRDQFSQGFMDADLLHVITTGVPPGDIKSVGSFRPFVAKIETAVQDAEDEKAAELQRKLRQADLDHLVAQINKDVEALEKHLIPSDRMAEEHALDMKQGVQYVEKWLGKHCTLRKVSDTMDAAIPDFLKWKEQFRSAGEQKGIPCHETIVEALLAGMTLNPVDVVMLVDCLPNRFCEMGRAMAARNLKENARAVHYFGYVLNEFDKNLADIRSKVYDSWDTSPTSPPKTRVAREEARSPPSLNLLAWSNGAPLFPAALLSRFQEGTSEHLKMEELKESFVRKFPPAAAPSPSTSGRGGRARAGGLCDFSIDGDQQPLDPSRLIDLPQIPADSFTVARKAECGAAGKKPSIAIDETFGIWLGNLTDADITVQAGELFGFGRGSYEQKEVRDIKDIIHGVPWRLRNDLSLIAFEKELMPMCQLLRKLAVDNGLSEVQLPDHILTPRMGGTVPVCFRYEIKPVASMTTNVFKPVREDREDPDWRHSTLGGYFVGHMEKLVDNKRASVVWEAMS